MSASINNALRHFPKINHLISCKLFFRLTLSCYLYCARDISQQEGSSEVLNKHS